jgi:hypothetical protein
MPFGRTTPRPKVSLYAYLLVCFLSLYEYLQNPIYP